VSRLSYDRELFYPLEGKPRRARFATIDLESKDGPTENKGFTRPFLAGFYDGEKYSAFLDTNPGGDPMTRAVRTGGCIDRLMHCCLSGKRHGWTYYCHNGGGFDFLHLLPWLMRHLADSKLTMNLIPVGNSRLLSIHVRIKGQKWGGWKFVDSIRTLPMSVDQAGKTFVGKQKLLGTGSEAPLLTLGGEPFTLDAPSWDPAWIPYNERDCVLLYDVLQVAHDVVENEFGGEMGLTAPATAMKTFRRAFLPAPIRRDTATHAFVREGYFGGRTEVLISEGHHLSDYDINSSYPHAMTQPMPIGGAECWGDSEPPEEWRRTRIGFCRVTVSVPDDIELPPLPVRADGAFFPEGSGLDGKLLFPTGTLKGVWEWDELQNAVENGCRILEWHESVWYVAGPLLAEFVEKLYRYRDKAHCFRCGGKIPSTYHCAACDEPGYLVGLDAWAKLLLNSLYGKTGQRPERTSYHYAGDPELPEGSMPLVSEDPHCPIWVAQTEVDSPFIMPQIAARVTAIARVTLYRAAKRAMRSVVRECWKCHSKVTYHGQKTGNGWVLGARIGGSGTHGDEQALVTGRTIGPQGSVCPCGGAIQTRQGRVYYMDTDSLLTDANLPSSKKLGELKDEVPRFAGFLHGRFYASKMYVLMVEPSYLGVSREVRHAMMMRDGSYLGSLGLRIPPQTVEGALDQPAVEAKWTTVRSKGLSKKNRTAENLAQLYDGALARLEWAADPEHRYADGSLQPMPDEVETAGTVVDTRLEQFGTLANLLERDEEGEPRLFEEDDGTWHVRATPFVRGPLMVDVPRRLHLEGAKRKLLPDGRSVPHSVDMTTARPKWWIDREERRSRLRAARAARAPTQRVSGKKWRRS
jgi:DNA polymerase family B